MRLNDISFPYPVLGIADDVRPLLKEDAVVFDSPKSDAKNFYFHIHLHQRNKDIAYYIDQGRAEYTCEVSCVRTFYRRCFKSSTPDIEITIGRKEICGRVEFNSAVIVMKEIASYVNRQFNEDYEGMSFRLVTGDALVIFPTANYNVDIKYDKLYAAGSYMQIEDGGMEISRPYFNIDGSKIVIQLPQKMYDEYKTFISNDRDYMEMLHSSLVLNALTNALYHYNDDSYKDRLWHECIEYRLMNEDKFKDFMMEGDKLDVNKVYDIAQELLGDPYNRLFERIKKNKEGEQA